MNNKFIYLGTIKKEFWYLIFLALISLAINIVNEIRGKNQKKMIMEVILCFISQLCF